MQSGKTVRRYAEGDADRIPPWDVIIGNFSGSLVVTDKGEEKVVFRAYLEPEYVGDVEATGITGSTSAEAMAQAREVYPGRTIIVTTQDLADPSKYILCPDS